MSVADDVGSFVARKIAWLSRPGAAQRAALAKLRRSVGRELADSPEAWDVVLKDAPDFMISENGEATYAERAVFAALTLFALHQQGKTESVSKFEMAFGKAARRLVSPDESNEQTIKCRLDTALTAKDFIEFTRHVRGLIQLMKAKGVYLDYSQFAKDLFWYQLPEQRRRVMLRWGEDFWVQMKAENENQESSEGENHE